MKITFLMDFHIEYDMVHFNKIKRNLGQNLHKNQ